MFYSPAFSFSSGYPLGFGFLAGLRLWALRWFQAFLASSARPACASSFCFRSAVRLRSIFGLAVAANRSVKPTRLRRAAYFCSLGSTNGTYLTHKDRLEGGKRACCWLGDFVTFKNINF